MLSVLLKKQMLEVFSWIYRDKKSGKTRDKKGIIGFLLLYVGLFVFLGFVFFQTALSMCAPLTDAGMGWLYWCIMAIVAVGLAVFGSVFNTYGTLYTAKDNNMLLSMPIPINTILFARLAGVYAMGLMYELIVMIPAVIVWFISAPLTIVGCVSVLLIPFVLSIAVLVLSAILGFVVATIAKRLKHKNFVIVLASILFIALYYYVYGRSYEILQSIIVEPEKIGNLMKTIFYPLYQMGLGAEGNIISTLIFIAVNAVIFALTYLVLSHSFLKLATTDRGTAKKKYRKKSVRQSSIASALLKKELQRFVGSANYMLNCGLGIIIMPLAAIMLAVKSSDIIPLSDQLSAPDRALVAIGAICILCSMNIISAPSVSLEGKSLWLTQTLPVSAKDILAAKLKAHVVLTIVPAMTCVISVCVLIRPTLPFMILTPITIFLFVVFTAASGLALNLKMPNTEWTNEVVPIKQSMPVMITLFGAWASIMVLAVGYILLCNVISALVYIISVCLILSALNMALLKWIMRSGAKIFVEL